jgi:hypothetical protein
MTDVVIQKLEDLDKAARDAAVSLNKASGKNAVWDKALKALKPGLADLEKVRKDAQKEPEQADKLVAELQGNYESAVSDSVRSVRTNVDLEIKSLEDDVSRQADALKDCRESAAVAQKALEESTAIFDASQKNLQGLSKQIQDRQKALAALQAEVRDADGKNQLVEAVVKLEDLKEMAAKFKGMILQAYESDLWNQLTRAADDLIKKTEAHLDAQASVSESEAEYNKAKAKHEDAQKNRLDTIKKKAADEAKSVVKAEDQPAGNTGSRSKRG